MSMYEKDVEEVSDPFSLTSKEGQKHLKALNEELKALNEQGSSKLSQLHGPRINSVEQTSIKRVFRKKKQRLNVTREQVLSPNAQRMSKTCKDSPRPVSNKSKNKMPDEDAADEELEANTSGNEATETAIDKILDEKAWKANLSAVNVKNILRYVVTNEQVLAMIDQKMKVQDGISGDEEMMTCFEPKLTRSKIKELMEKDVKIPWPISPMKNPSSSKRLIELEFLESDASSDEEYQPEILPKNTDETEGSLQSSPTSEVEAKLNQIDNLESPSDDNLESFESTIALRTRSKLPLKDTSLETIEANFIAPDITVDMYDSECYDENWRDFLRGLVKPLEIINTDVVDDEANDPEYNFLEEEDILDVEDLRDDRAVRISKKELHELMAELLEFTENDFTETEDEYNQPSTSTILLPRPNLVFEDDLNNVSELNQPEDLFNSERKQILAEQMRKHVQLLVQTFLLASADSDYCGLKDMNKSFLEELDCFANKNETTYGRPSFFSAQNLKNAIDITLSFKNENYRAKSLKSAKGNSNKQKVPDSVLHTMVHNKAFIYPELLPFCGFKPPSQFKCLFTQSEDNLIALGLEQFFPLKEFVCWQLIKDHMIPIKTANQIFIRVKNLRCKSKDPANPIKYYYKNNRAPQIVHHVQLFDDNSISPIFKRNKSALPDIFKNYLSENRKLLSDNCSKQLRILPAPRLVNPPEINSSNNINRKTPVKNHPYVSLKEINNCEVVKDTSKSFLSGLEKEMHEKILRNSEGKCGASIISTSSTSRLTPLKQVSPILKKYNINALRRTGGNMKNARKTMPILMPKHLSKPIVVEEELKSTAPNSKVLVSAELLEEKVNSRISDDIEKPTSGAEEISVPSTPANESHQPVVIEKGILRKDVPGCELIKESQMLSDFRDSGSEIDDGDDTADELADNADDLAALMTASTTIKSIPKQKQNIIKRKKQKSDQKVLLDMLSCNTIELELNPDKENAYAEAYLQRVKDTVGVNSTYESFLKTLHEFKNGDQNVIKLYNDICETLKDYPELCDEFVFFLFPEQAFECGKLMEYLNMTKMQVFLKKLEIHFRKNPQHIHKLIRAISQVQQQDNPGMEDLMKVMMPLRGQQHLMEEFLQMFPQEPVSKIRMSDFEEIYIPDSNEELITDERGYETLAFPEQNDTYGGPDCICSCHQLDKPKIQNKTRHCAECGIKFIDGRLFLQTGKVLKPCKIIYLNAEDIENKRECDGIPSKQGVSCMPSSLISPTSSASSLSPPINSDDEKEPLAKIQRLSGDSLGKITNVDDSKVVNMPPLPESSNDEVIVTDESSKMLISLGTSDFTTFRQVSSQNGLQPSCESHSISDVTKRSSAPNISSTQKGDSPSDGTRKDNLEFITNPNRWTRESDRILLQTCQRLKASKETFATIASQLETRIEEVELRFNYLMSIFAQKEISDDKRDKVDV